MSKLERVSVAVFASGLGTNAEALIQYQRRVQSCHYSVQLILTNRSTAGVIDVANSNNIPCVIVQHKAEMEESVGFEMVEHLSRHNIELICLAGYLQKIPLYVTERFRDRIINIHPALLPRYGGKGMYGTKVFEAVIAAHEEISGVSVHLVNEEYDEGQILAQEQIQLEKDETVQSLAQKTQKVEHKLYPEVVDKVTEMLLRAQVFLKKNTPKENL